MGRPNEREIELALEIDAAIVDAETSGATIEETGVRVQALIACALAAYRAELASNPLIKEGDRHG